MKAPVICAGRLYCDLIFTGAPRLPTLGTETFAPHLSLHAGGGAFITGATFAALGHSVTQFSYLPAAPFDTTALADMASHGVDASACQPANAGADPQITVAIATAGDRAFLTRAAGPAVPELASTDFTRFRHLHIGELRTLQDTPDLINRARGAGLTISLDCGWQDTFGDAVANLIAAVDVFLPNMSEAAALSGIGISETCAPLTVVKCGETGARARRQTDAAWTRRPIASTVDVLDTTGAGDAFNAGFLSGWLDNADLDTCLAQGNACGAATVQVVGGIAVPALG